MDMNTTMAAGAMTLRAAKKWGADNRVELITEFRQRSTTATQTEKGPSLPTEIEGGWNGDTKGHV